MFETIETHLPTLRETGGFALLDSYAFQKGHLTVQLRVAGTQDGLELTFENVIGLTMSEDVFGSNGGQITRESLARQKGQDQPKPVGFFRSSGNSPTLQAVREAVPEEFSGAVENHVHFLLSLREHELSFVADGAYAVEPMSFDMAS